MRAAAAGRLGGQIRRERGSAAAGQRERGEQTRVQRWLRERGDKQGREKAELKLKCCRLCHSSKPTRSPSPHVLPLHS
ncbi:hypothetical protein AAC387_Pa04g0991 [Persea americana]